VAIAAFAEQLRGRIAMVELHDDDIRLRAVNARVDLQVLSNKTAYGLTRNLIMSHCALYELGLVILVMPLCGSSLIGFVLIRHRLFSWWL
jgi:hypothetical protein